MGVVSETGIVMSDAVIVLSGIEVALCQILCDFKQGSVLDTGVALCQTLGL